MLSEIDCGINSAFSIALHAVAMVRDVNRGALAPSPPPRLFLLFPHLNIYTGKAEGGRGVGLSLSKRNVDTCIFFII